MFLKYFLNCDIELKFSGYTDFENYLKKNEKISNLLEIRN